MSKKKLAGIILGCAIIVGLIVAVIVFKGAHPGAFDLTLNVSPSGAGSISVSSGSYEVGELISLSAQGQTEIPRSYIAMVRKGT
jgi:hypothetical protein